MSDLTAKACRRHKVLPCPPTCWVPSRTFLSIYDGKLVHARTFNSHDAAQAWADAERLRIDNRAARYAEAELPLPEQYGKWLFKVWNGEPIE